jgi:IS66 C-terminal element
MIDQKTDETGRRSSPRAPDSGHYEPPSDEGGRRAAHIYTIVESARLNGLNPQAYFADVIDRMAKGWPRSRLVDLLPWNWSATRAIEATATGPPAG